jgi:hypothetical protein
MKNCCKHGINQNGPYVCATCTTGSKYFVKRRYIKKQNIKFDRIKLAK